jgi:hypothetical protein
MRIVSEPVTWLRTRTEIRAGSPAETSRAVTVGSLPPGCGAGGVVDGGVGDGAGGVAGGSDGDVLAGTGVVGGEVGDADVGPTAPPLPAAPAPRPGVVALRCADVPARGAVGTSAAGARRAVGVPVRATAEGPTEALVV